MDSITTFLLDDGNNIYDDLYFSFPAGNYGLFLRAIAETVDNSAELVLDITSLVHAGYYRADEDVIANTIQGQLNSALPYQKSIILNEGRSDTLILSKSLELLYPHLASYFSFMDFDTVKTDGGTSALERTVKSFAAAGISNIIIALFDNDTAGVAAFNNLRKTALPKNIVPLLLPNLDIAKAYPTIGPQGTTVDNVNGRACSIEMYLGENLLRDAKGDLIPIKWSSLDSRINEYQGEIIGKNEVQTRFHKFIKEIETDKTKFHEHDWVGLRSIFQMIFSEVSKL